MVPTRGLVFAYWAGDRSPVQSSGIASRNLGRVFDTGLGQGSKRKKIQPRNVLHVS